MKYEVKYIIKTKGYKQKVDANSEEQAKYYCFAKIPLCHHNIVKFVSVTKIADKCDNVLDNLRDMFNFK